MSSNDNKLKNINMIIPANLNLNELTNTFNKDYIGQQYYEYIKPNDLPIKKYELKSIIKEQDNSNNSSISNNNQFESKKNTTQLNKKIYTRLYNSNNNQSNINNNQSNSKKNTTQINKKMYTRLYNSNNNQSNSNNNQSNSNNNQSNSKKKNNTNQNDEYKQNKIILISSDFDVEYVTINNKNKIIKLVKRSNLIIRNIEDYKFNRLLESVEKKYHYVSINSTINNIVDNHIVTFDLYRIKLNVELPNISISKFDEINKNKLIFKSSNNNLYNISIPAEFLDISIPKFNDINLNKFRDNFNLESFNTFFSILNFTDNDINYLNIITYSLEYLLDDLNLVLFKQNTFMPWIDSKYEKRINRLCCLSLLLIIKNSKKYGFKSEKIQNEFDG